MLKNERVEWLKQCSVKEQRQYDHDIKSMPCAVESCGVSAPSDSHHCYGHNFPAKRPHRPRIPLCKDHHQGNNGIHNGKKTFEDKHGDQEYLLSLTEAKLENSNSM